MKSKFLLEHLQYNLVNTHPSFLFPNIQRQLHPHQSLILNPQIQITFTLTSLQFYCLIVCIKMSRKVNSPALNTSLGSTSFRERMQSTLPTVIGAVSKLKQSDDQVYQAIGRYKVLNRHLSKQQMHLYNREQMNYFCTAVQQSARNDRQIKQQNERRKMEELKMRFSINTKKREENRRMIDNVKKSFEQANHQLYEQIRTKRMKNEERVKNFRYSFLQEKTEKRKKASEEKDIRRRSIQNFYESRVSSVRKSKEDDVSDMLSRSNSRHKLLDTLQSRNSQVRERKISLSRDLSVRSLNNPEKETLNQQ